MSISGTMLYKWYFRPIGKVRDVLRQGVWASIQARIGARELRMVAMRELDLPRPPKDMDGHAGELVFAYLGGVDNFDQLFASISSLYLNWPSCPQVHLISDGTLTRELGRKFERYFPGLRAFSDDMLNGMLGKSFPEGKFPNLRSLRSQFVLARKFMDLRSVASRWVIFVDADTVFISRPQWLVTWASSPESCFYLVDRRNAYGYPISEMQSLLDVPLLEQVNTGLFAMNLQNVDWQELERWYGILSVKTPDNHFVEQSLLAMVFSGLDAVPLPGEYVCEPTPRQSRHSEGCFHHYVRPCRYLLFGHAWRRPVFDYLASLERDP